MSSPLTVQDRLVIMDLIAGYALSIDSRDIEGYVDVFAADAILDHIGGRAVGHDEIRARVSYLLESGRAHPGLRHFVGMPLIRGDGERAFASTYCVILEYDGQQRIAVPLGREVRGCARTRGRALAHPAPHDTRGAVPSPTVDCAPRHQWRNNGGWGSTISGPERQCGTPASPGARPL